VKSKMGGSIQWAALDSSAPTLLFFVVLGHNDILVIYLGL
jgi:hypothetical protein